MQHVDVAGQTETASGQRISALMRESFFRTRVETAIVNEKMRLNVSVFIYCAFLFLPSIKWFSRKRNESHRASPFSVLVLIKTKKIEKNEEQKKTYRRWRLKKDSCLAQKSNVWFFFRSSPTSKKEKVAKQEEEEKEKLRFLFLPFRLNKERKSWIARFSVFLERQKKKVKDEIFSMKTKSDVEQMFSFAFNPSKSKKFRNRTRSVEHRQNKSLFSLRNRTRRILVS